MSRTLVLVRRRLAQAVPSLLIVLTLNFLLLRLAPGDVVDTLAITAGGADPALAAALRAEYGLDLPWPAQLAVYIGKTLHFDLGRSFFHNRPVADLILERLPATLLLMFASLALAVSLGTALGAAAALKAGTWKDAAIVALGAVVYAMPSFWTGLMLIVLFAVHLAWLPVGGLATPASGLTGLAHGLDVARHLVLPTLTLSPVFAVLYMRLVRAGMIEVAGADFVRTARAKGLSRWQTARRHMLRHALLPAVTMLGLQSAALLGGSVVVETVFSLPGVGRLAFEAVLQRDVNLLLGIVFASATVVIAVNLAIDALYARIDPRIGER